VKLTTDAAAGIALAADDPRAVTGVAVPYRVVTAKTALGRQVFEVGAFGASVEHWTGRKDGARLPYRARHGERPNGVVTVLEDAPDGVHFRAQIFEGADGDRYLAEVAAGLNGVSVEAALPDRIRKARDGTVVWREAEITGIAGADNPAFDGARIVAMSEEETRVEELETPPAEEAEPQGTIAAQHEATASDPLVAAISRSPIVIARQPGVYAAGSGASFLRDLMHSREGDAQAAERQARHYAQLGDLSRSIERIGPAAFAGDVLSSEIPGAYPNDYLPGLLTPRILKGRPMGSFFNRVPITDATPKIFAKVTTSTSVAVQSAEGANPAASDLATTAVTATPLLYGAETVVSRQTLDGGDPSAANMILQDMIEAYAQASEAVIVTAVEAGASASGTAITAATPFAGALGNVVKYYTTRFRPALGQFVPAALFAVLLAEADTAGRPKMPLLNPVNSDGTTAPGGVSGSILSATTYLSYGSTTNVVVTARPEDYVIYESSIARFSYDAVTGPSGVRIGIWAYLVVGTRLGGLKVTAA
jgi:hypothetical protein